MNSLKFLHWFCSTLRFSILLFFCQGHGQENDKAPFLGWRKTSVHVLRCHFVVDTCVSGTNFATKRGSFIVHLVLSVDERLKSCSKQNLCLMTEVENVGHESTALSSFSTSVSFNFVVRQRRGEKDQKGIRGCIQIF